MKQNKTIFLKKHAIWKANEEKAFPNVDFVPPLIRRRLTQIEKIGIYIANELKEIRPNTKIIFASQFGEWQQTIKLIEQMYNEKEMSPAGFSHSVHNAMPGLLSVYKHITNNYTTIAANEQTIESALLEALITKENALLIYAEENVPEFYKNHFNKKWNAVGIGMLLSQRKTKGTQEIKIHFKKAKASPVTSENLINFIEKSEKITSSLFSMEKQ